MIDWGKVLSNSLWLAGLALLLATAGYCASVQPGRRSSPRTLWREVARSPWKRLGGVLFSAGMALTSGSTLEGALWGLLTLYTSFECIRALRALLRPNSSAPDFGPTCPPESHIAQPLGTALRKSAEWLVKTELVWLALLSPAFIFPSPSYALALLGVPVLWLARWVARARPLPSTPLDWPLVLLAVMALVSLYATSDIGFSLGKVAGLIYGIALFYAIVEWARSKERISWALALYVTLGSALAVVGLLGTEWVNKLPVLKQLGEHLPALVRGLPGAENGIHPNELGGALLWVVPLQVALLGWSFTSGLRVSLGRWALRFALLLVTALGAGTLLLTQSRSALSGFLVGGALLTLLGLWRFKWALLALVVVAGGTVAYVGPQRIADRLTAASALGFNTTDSLRSIGGRAEIWSRALYGIEDFSFTGMGMNAFRKIMPVLYPTRAIDLEPEPNLDGTAITEIRDIGHAHNHLLQAALDLGLPGLVAYLAIWMLAAAMSVVAWRGSRNTLHRAAIAGIGAALLAYFIYGVTDTVALGAKPGVFFWALLGLLTALWRYSHSAELPMEMESMKNLEKVKSAEEGEDGNERTQERWAVAQDSHAAEEDTEKVPVLASA